MSTFREQGRYVAMTGDGVNDVLSMKRSNLAIAMGSGSQATRGVADLILIDDGFAALASAIGEGQRILNGMQDILRVFLTRILSLGMLIVSALVIGFFPVDLRNASVITLFTVGIPTALLAVWARPGRQPQETLQQTLARFVVPPAAVASFLGLLVVTVVLLMAQADRDAGLIPADSVEPIARTAVTAFLVYAGPPAGRLRGAAASVAGRHRAHLAGPPADLAGHRPRDRLPGRAPRAAVPRLLQPAPAGPARGGRRARSAGRLDGTRVDLLERALRRPLPGHRAAAADRPGRHAGGPRGGRDRYRRGPEPAGGPVDAPLRPREPRSRRLRREREAVTLLARPSSVVTDTRSHSMTRTQTHHAPFAVTALLTLGLVASQALGALAQDESPAAEPIPTDTIEGITWQLQEQVVDGALAPVPEGVVVTLLLEGGRDRRQRRLQQLLRLVHARWRRRDLQRHRLHAHGSASQPAGDIESAYFSNLATVATWFSDGGSLTLVDGAGNPAMRFGPALPSSRCRPTASRA